MSEINKLLETKINGLNVKLFEYDIENENSFNKIKEYLINKVKKTKIHNASEYDLTYFGAKNLDPEFVKKFSEQVANINIPKKAKVPQFDVRRERVTEWMAQYLLEKEYDCSFYDEADKRLNIKNVEIDKHTDGIDVPGIRIVGENIHFVVCEVKASEEKGIPCSSVKGLQEDIQKAVDNVDNRTTREILQYIYGLKDVKIKDDVFEKIIGFLTGLIVGEEKDLAESITFFPFLIRNNEEIVVNKKVDDFKNFNLSGLNSENVENIILTFQTSFSDFSDNIYKEAIGD